MTRSFVVCLGLLLAAPTMLVAQPAPAPGWAGGVGILVSDSELAGEGARVIAVPVLTYESERWFVQGPLAGVHLYQADGFRLDATLSARFDGWDADDLGRAELASNGIDRDLLADRDFGADLGLTASWRGDYGRLDLSARSDISGASEGQELRLEYAAALPVAGGLLLPGASVSYWSDDLADYYYGTLREEVARGVIDYRPGSFVMPSLRLGYQRGFAEHWGFFAQAEYRFLPDEVRDSPLVEQDRSGAVGVIFAVTRRF